LPDIDEFEKGQKLNMEKELLGFYLTEHPHAEKLARMGDHVTHRIADLYTDNHSGQKVTVGGIVETCRVVMTKTNNQPMCFAKLSDLGKSIEVVVFPKTYGATQEHWKVDNLVLVTGKVEQEEEEDSPITLIADSAQAFEDKIINPVNIYIEKGLPSAKLVALNTLLSANKGSTPANLVFESKTMPLPYGLNWKPELVKAIDNLLK
jgi:DNA polymerase-3 subunit alpha